MPALIAASAGSDWTYGGSILTFVFPMILFLGVAAALYVLYTKPQVVPGGRGLVTGRSVAATLDANEQTGAHPATTPAAEPATAGTGTATETHAPGAAGPAETETAAGQTGTSGTHAAPRSQTPPAESADGK